MAPREQVLRHRFRIQELDVTNADPTELAVLDLGVQQGAGEAARTALVNRGVSVPDARRLTGDFSEELVKVWAWRGAPHYFRRTEVRDVQTALSPSPAPMRGNGVAPRVASWPTASRR
ncbi:hypothetical protein HJ590_03280 [Naumannella sp. ID2617S]|nr:hypothetical protein [Naumannella sp. ID2617S]